MKRLMRWSAYLVVALVFVGVALYLAFRASLLPLHGERLAQGVEQPVEIRFDALQRPYVRAQSLGDALFAQGWLHATQRLWQMELLRRAGRGRLAEMLGPDLLETDKELWRMGVPQLARQLEANATPGVRALTERYVAGVNAGIAALPVRPPEFLLTVMPLPTIETRDVYALGAVLAVESARNQSGEQLRLALANVLSQAEFSTFLPDESRDPKFPYVMPSAHPVKQAAQPGPSLFASALVGRLAGVSDLLDHHRLPHFALGSNSWAIAPSRSKNGHALFSFDSHDELALPNLFYEVHLFFGERQLRGWSVPGMPGVINGYNERMAWGFTNIGDTQDLFIETRDPDNPLRFKHGEHWIEGKRVTVEIPVRGRDAPEKLDIIYSHHGPLISEYPPLALVWTAHRLGKRGIDALLQINLARNWDDFTQALDGLAAPSLNATYADIDGHIGQRVAGLLPQRGAGEGQLPLDGALPGNDWRGVVPPEHMPRRYDPPEAYVGAANARVNARGNGPLVSADNASNYRIARIQSVLGHAQGFTADDMRALQADWRDNQADQLLPVLLAALDAEPQSDAAWRAATDALKRWQADPQDTPALAAPLIFQHWYLQLARDLFAEKLGPELMMRVLKNNYLLNHTLDRLLLNDADSVWWQGGRDVRIRASFATTLRTLAQAHGADPAQWRYDQRQQFTARHELGKAIPPLGLLFNAGPFPASGGPSTVGRGSYSYFKPFAMRYGATVRTTIELSPVPQATSVIPGGQSGHPLSAHYADQLPQWLAGRQSAIAATPESVSGASLILKAH